MTRAKTQNEDFDKTSKSGHALGMHVHALDQEICDCDRSALGGNVEGPTTFLVCAHVKQSWVLFQNLLHPIEPAGTQEAKSMHTLVSTVMPAFVSLWLCLCVFEMKADAYPR